jgi:hypothetical protein
LKALSAVHDEVTFISFLAVLKNDRQASAALERSVPGSPYGPDAGGWENATIEDFLDASVRWAHDSTNGNRFYKAPDDPRRRCADILFAAIIYE